MFSIICKLIKEKVQGAIPMALIGETGVWKERTEVTMTTTRFTQLPTEWVTGDTLSNIMYETYTRRCRVSKMSHNQLTL